MTASFKFPHVEDYIEIIAGLREPSGKATGLFSSNNPVISLARYDTKIIPSLATQTHYNAIGYTDKQAVLAAQLVLKYERQLAKLGLDVSPVKEPKYRLNVRIIDRSTRVWIDDDKIYMRFPFNAEYIEAVKKASQNSQGSFMYNRDLRCHQSALTEWNLNWIYAFAKQKNFEIDSSVHSAMDLVLDAEKIPHKIELIYKDDQLKITNAATSLLDYIDEHVGGLAPDNLLKVCDQAPLLGFDIHEDIAHEIIKTFGPRFYSLCANRNLRADSVDDLASKIVDYARVVERFPIYVYEPDMSQRLFNIFSQLFDSSELLIVPDNAKEITVSKDIKLIYTTKLPKRYFSETVPLMISSAGMMFGGDRELWLQASQKVVYFSHDVYNKSIQGNEICKLD